MSREVVGTAPGGEGQEGETVKLPKPYRVLRGGAWPDSARSVRCAYRDASVPGFRRAFGFRLVSQVKRKP